MLQDSLSDQVLAFPAGQKVLHRNTEKPSLKLLLHTTSSVCCVVISSASRYQIRQSCTLDHADSTCRGTGTCCEPRISRGMSWECKGRKRTAHTPVTGTWLFFFSRMVVPSSTSNSPWSLKHRTCKVETQLRVH